MSRFNDDNYASYNVARWQALDTAALFSDYNGVRVLDLGAGDGVFADTYFTPKGAIVYPVEARDENLAAMRRDRPHLHERAQQMNLEEKFPTVQAEHEPYPLYDMVLCVGLLYHIQTPALLLANIAEAAPVLFLETVIWQTPDDTGAMVVKEHQHAFDQAYSGYGVRVSVDWLDHNLKALYPYVYRIRVPSHSSFNGANRDEQRVIRVASQHRYPHLEQV